MVPHSLNIASSDGSSQVLWEDGERAFRRGWRLDDEGKRRAVLLVAPAADHPSRSNLDRLAPRAASGSLRRWSTASVAEAPQLQGHDLGVDLPDRPLRADYKRRVGEGVAPLAPHRSGRADFPH